MSESSSRPQIGGDKNGFRYPLIRCSGFLGSLNVGFDTIRALSRVSNANRFRIILLTCSKFLAKEI
jgi:hypothetical protein